MKKYKWKVLYKRDVYNVTLHQKWQIEFIKIQLCIKRFWRNIRRIIFENNKQIPLLIILWTIYCIVIYFLSIYLMKTSHTFKEILWEAKSGLFTSVIVTWVLSFQKIELIYRKRLWDQHDLYVESMHCFSKIFGVDTFDLLFYTDELFLKEIHNVNCNEFSNITIDSNIIVEIQTQIDIIHDELKNDNLFGIKYEDLLKYIREWKKQKSKINGNYNVEKFKFSRIANNLYNIICEIRKPWRIDLVSNIKILKLIINNNENKERVSDHFYLRMILGDEIQI